MANKRLGFSSSTNGGTSFAYLNGISNSRGEFINASDFDDNTSTLYSGDDAGNYFCITGLNGTPVGAQRALPSLGTREVTAVATDPVTANAVWFGASFGGNVPQILKVENANTASPNVVVNSNLPVAANASISSIDVDDENPNRLLATVSNYGVASVFISTDGGQSWTNIEGNLPDMPVRWGLFAPQGAQLEGAAGGGILLATELGVWTTSTISGSTTQWLPNNGGFPNVRTNMLKYRASDYLVLAASHGRGLFTTNLTGVTTGLPTVPNTPNFIQYISATTDLLIVRGGLNIRKISIQLFDMNGRIVQRMERPYENTKLPLHGISSGSYIVRITGNGKEVFTSQFIKQ